jgi:hypothetical protein
MILPEIVAKIAVITGAIVMTEMIAEIGITVMTAETAMTAMTVVIADVTVTVIVIATVIATVLHAKSVNLLFLKTMFWCQSVA